MRGWQKLTLGQIWPAVWDVWILVMGTLIAAHHRIYSGVQRSSTWCTFTGVHMLHIKPLAENISKFIKSLLFWTLKSHVHIPQTQCLMQTHKELIADLNEFISNRMTGKGLQWPLLISHTHHPEHTFTAWVSEEHTFMRITHTQHMVWPYHWTDRLIGFRWADRRLRPAVDKCERPASVMKECLVCCLTTPVSVSIFLSYRKQVHT